MDILFFSRGRGRGHAIPDAAIMGEVAQIRPGLEWALASYATGSKTFKSLGYDVYDLDLPEENPFLATVINTYKLIEKCHPRFVVAHEEPAALVAAKLMQVPSIFITDWFVSDTTILMQPLAYSDSILFLENRGVFDEPSYAGGKVQYMGPLMRKMSYTREDRSRAREELDLSKEGLVIACLPGGWATEARAPIADLMLSAFNQLLQTDKKLFWIAGCDTDSLIKKTKDRDDVVVMEQLWPIEQLLVASDAVITKGNRGTIMEAAYLGIPSVSLSHGLNSVEEFLVPRIGSNHALRVKGLTPEHLAICIENQLRRSKTDFLPRPVVVPASAVALALIARLGF